MGCRRCVVLLQKRAGRPALTLRRGAGFGILVWLWDLGFAGLWFRDLRFGFRTFKVDGGQHAPLQTHKPQYFLRYGKQPSCARFGISEKAPGQRCITSNPADSWNKRQDSTQFDPYKVCNTTCVLFCGRDGCRLEGSTPILGLHREYHRSKVQYQ